ncbi:MAG: hypothetical protein ACHRHE_10865 [Tepidisphaerales bacterium]
MDTPHTDKSSAATPGGGWTIMFLCAGIAVIAACILIPEADENQRLLWQAERLRLDLEHVQKEVATNEEFVKRVAEDPILQERLAQRQLKYVRQGTGVLDLGQKDELGSHSPFPLVSVPPAPALEPTRTVGGKFASLCRDSRSRLYLMGGALMLIALGLVLGAGLDRN